MKILSVILSVAFAVLFQSCSTGSNNSVEKEIKPQASISDTVLFKYVLGSSKKEVEKHTNHLLKNKEIKSFTTKILTMTIQTEKARFEESGYPCMIYLDEDSIPALMSFTFYNDTLVSQRFYTYGKSLSFNKLSELYGKPESTSNGSYRHLGDKAISTKDYSGHKILLLEKISLVDKMNAELTASEEAKKDEEMKNSKKKSEKMGW